MLKPKMSKHIAKNLLNRISTEQQIRIMEVCGTHTMAIAKSGVKQLLPANVKLISGPGCPVCVTDQTDIEKILLLAKKPEVIITTFGDMIRVPGSTGSMQDMQANGADIRIVYSPLDAVDLALRNPKREVVFVAVGFETTAPTVAMAIEEAYKLNINNFSIISLHKLVIPALTALLEDEDNEINGFLCPGHVSTIIGTLPYEFIPQKYNRGCVVSGFEPGDIIESILLLTEQIRLKSYKVENQYRRGVKTEGNKIALALLEKYFAAKISSWRGLGDIPDSGLCLRKEYAKFDALEKFDLKNVEVKVAPTGCLCGQVLKGKLDPTECNLFNKICTPSTPVGPCMVSSEGSCAASYHYSGGELIG